MTLELTNAEERHVPVLLQRCLDLFAPALEAEGAVYVDGTLGMAGHSVAVLQRFPTARLIGIDRDTKALALAKDRLERSGVADRATLVHATYDEIPEALADNGIAGAQAILLDLGVSSMQLDEADRGFAYAQTAPLDMRMDQDADVPTAADLLNTLSEQEIAKILFVYGEEKFSRKIARDIVRVRQDVPFTTSDQLVELLRKSVPAASQRTGGHPAKRTFQALRIAVNTELDTLRAAIPNAMQSLAVGGRLVVLSYHSLEDRITKQEFREGSTSKTPPGLPVEIESLRPSFNLLVRNGEQATEQEIAENSRATSVRLRAIERTRIS